MTQTLSGISAAKHSARLDHIQNLVSSQHTTTILLLTNRVTSTFALALSWIGMFQHSMQHSSTSQRQRLYQWIRSSVSSWNVPLLL